MQRPVNRIIDPNNGGERGWRGQTGTGVNAFVTWTVVNDDLQTGTSTFSTSEQLAVGVNPGSSPAMFGGIASTYSGTGAGLDASDDLFAKVSVLTNANTGPNNTLVTRMNGTTMVAGSTILNRAAWLVDQSNFLALTTGTIGLSNVSFTMNKPADLTNSGYDVRMVILGNDSNYYVSATNMAGSSTLANSFTIADLSTETWVNLGSSGETLISTGFGSYGAASLAAATSFTAAGFIYEQTVSAATGNQQLYLGGMSLAIVPEPSTYALLTGFMALGLILMRRKLR